MPDPKVVKAKYGEDHYKKIGALGGKKSRKGGFYVNRKLARKAGAIGGRKSNRLGVPNKSKV